MAGVYRYLLITSNGPLLGEFVGKVGFEPTNLQFQVLVFTDVTLYFTIIAEETRKSVFEFLPHIIADLEGFEPPSLLLTASRSTARAIGPVIVEQMGIEPISLVFQTNAD